MACTILWELYYVLCTVCLHMNGKVHVACNFNCLLANEGHLKGLGCLIHYKYGNISETVQGGVVVLVYTDR